MKLQKILLTTKIEMNRFFLKTKVVVPICGFLFVACGEDESEKQIAGNETQHGASRKVTNRSRSGQSSKASSSRVGDTGLSELIAKIDDSKIDSLTLERIARQGGRDLSGPDALELLKNFPLGTIRNKSAKIMFGEMAKKDSLFLYDNILLFRGLSSSGDELAFAASIFAIRAVGDDRGEIAIQVVEDSGMSQGERVQLLYPIFDRWKTNHHSKIVENWDVFGDSDEKLRALTSLMKEDVYKVFVSDQSSILSEIRKLGAANPAAQNTVEMIARGFGTNDLDSGLNYQKEIPDPLKGRFVEELFVSAGEKNLRKTLEVLDAVADVVPKERAIVRLLPLIAAHDPDGAESWAATISDQELSRRAKVVLKGFREE
jgi:hypothetical protein